eukprot:2810033-Amphidinium_carterae.1
MKLVALRLDALVCCVAIYKGFAQTGERGHQFSPSRHTRFSAKDFVKAVRQAIYNSQLGSDLACNLIIAIFVEEICEVGIRDFSDHLNPDSFMSIVTEPSLQLTAA